ncbi:hypothetical protein BpHYR1_040782 [Brachionus plicatilis]|uniref:Uncharacterized protein n=1 Tax=Brachionus plicatilis TaxID=10195 RepID=A0A3M7Q1X5_BRAPC|nr:hypothetical protein BpHYR1_040782 [Brachionus plicatilis]
MPLLKLACDGRRAPFSFKKPQFVLSLWDESSTFLNSFGLYKGQNSSSYDRSIYNDLYNAPSFYRRDTANSRQVFKEPRLNICVLGHPPTFIELIKNEVNSKDDGLIQRFHLCAPDPEFIKDKMIMNAQQPACSLEVLFCIIWKLNEGGVNNNHIPYELSEAHDFRYIKVKGFGQLFENEAILFFKYRIIEFKITAASQVLSLSMVLNMLESSYKILFLPQDFFRIDKYIIDQNLINLCEKILQENTKIQEVDEDTDTDI